MRYLNVAAHEQIHYSPFSKDKYSFLMFTLFKWRFVAKKMIFWRRLRLRVVSWEGYRAFGGENFLMYVCNKNTAALGGVMLFNKNIRKFSG